MKLTSKGRYAVMALVDLARFDNINPVSLRDISLRQGISLDYLEQIFSKLKKNEIVKSIRGTQGGYVLNKNPNDIKLTNIFNAVDEKVKTVQCKKESKRGCNGKATKCITHNLWDELEIHINTFFENKSLDDLLGLYDFVNIKLDKTGGLTEAIKVLKSAREKGFKIMLGCMVGSSLAMAPAMLLAHMCDFVDLDGPLLLDEDRPNPLTYDNHLAFPPESNLWGH